MVRDTCKSNRTPEFEATGASPTTDSDCRPSLLTARRIAPLRYNLALMRPSTPGPARVPEGHPIKVLLLVHGRQGRFSQERGGVWEGSIPALNVVDVDEVSLHKGEGDEGWAWMVRKVAGSASS
jgi:hypothetical protein